MSNEYTNKYKREALAIVEELQGNISAAADHLQIPTRLLTCWVRRRTLLQQGSVLDKLKEVSIGQKKNPTTWASCGRPPASRFGNGGYQKKRGLTENLDMLTTEDSRMVSAFLSTIQSLTNDTLKLQQHQIGTLYPIEVEMPLPDDVHEFCTFDLHGRLGEGPPPESVQFTVLLSALASGDKMKPVMLVEGEPRLHHDKLPPNIKILVRDSLIFDSKVFAEWKTEVWTPAIDGQGLVIVHMVDVDKSLTPVYQNIAYLHENTMVALMPKNLTHLVHPAIVFWIRPFAEKFRARLAEWLEDANSAFMKQKKKRTASYELFSTWVVEAWEEIEQELVVSSFEACGLTHFTPTDLHAELQQFLDHHDVSFKKTKASPEIPVVELSDDDDDIQVLS